MVVCINGKVGRHRWMMGDCCIGKVEEYKYLGITIEGGKQGSFKSMVDQMKEANGLESNDGCGALTWYQHECDDLEVIFLGRWLWEIGKVQNELVRCIWMEFICVKGGEMYCGLAA